MRFATKFDRWLVITLVASFAAMLALPALRHFRPNASPPPQGILVMPLAIWAIVLPCMLPQYYEVRDNGLFLRQGWKKSLIPYSDLVSLEPVSDSRSAAVFSSDRVQIVTRNGKTWVIAPADQTGFLDAVLLRAPQLEKKGFRLALPLG